MRTDEINKKLKQINDKKIKAYSEVEKLRFQEMKLLKELETLKLSK